MVNWWNAVSVFEQILASLGIVSVLMLVLQILIMLFGTLGGGGTDADASGDMPDADANLGGGHGGDFSTDFDSDFGGDVVGDIPGDFGGDVGGDLGSHIASGHTSHYTVQTGDADMSSHTATGLRLFTVQGVISFLAIFSWSGLLMIKSGIHVAFSLIIAAILGFFAMFFMASLMRLMLRLQYDGTSDIRNAIGRVGSVYLTIPANRGHPGKVSIIVQENLMELEAITDEDESIPTGAQVFVSGISGRNTLVVKRK